MVERKGVDSRVGMFTHESRTARQAGGAESGISFTEEAV